MAPTDPPIMLGWLWGGSGPSPVPQCPRESHPAPGSGFQAAAWGTVELAPSLGHAAPHGHSDPPHLSSLWCPMPGMGCSRAAPAKLGRRTHIPQMSWPEASGCRRGRRRVAWPRAAKDIAALRLTHITPPRSHTGPHLWPQVLGAEMPAWQGSPGQKGNR